MSSFALFRVDKIRSAFSGKALIARLAGVLALGLVSASLVVVPANAETAAAATPTWPETVSADPLPTTQINGVAWTQQVVGNKVYVGGEFANARPAGAAAGTSLTARANLLAYNLTTGVLDTGWNPGTNATVSAMALSPDGSRLYIAGTFTTVAGQSRYRAAAFDTATGALTSWRPIINGAVAGIRATNSMVYMTGSFTVVGGASRQKMAAVSAASSATVLATFAPVLEGGWGGRAVEIAPDGSKVVVAGSFLSTNGSTTIEQGRGISALDPVTGALLQWKVSSVLHNAGDVSAMYSLSSDGDSVYGTAYDYGGSNVTDRFEGTFRASWTDGTMVWMEDCHGDTYGVAQTGGVVYTAQHTHYCGNIGEFPQENPWYYNHSLAWAKEPSGTLITPDTVGYRSFTGNPAAKLLHWYPKWTAGTFTGQNQAGWTVAAGGDYVLYGGEFTRIGSTAQQGLVRFAKRSIAPKKIGPAITGGNYVISARSFVGGMARIAWRANHDPDSPTMTYELFRQGTTAALYTTTASSTYWVRPSMSFTDSTVTAGTTYNYRVRVTDPDGNWTVSNWTPVTIASAGAATAYNSAVLSANPANYWPLGEASGTAGFDWAAGNDISLSATGITRGAAAPVSPATATGFSGAAGVTGASTVAQAGPQVFTVEAWFRTESRRGGKIVGFGGASTGNSSSYDRHIYLSNDGRVTFGVYPNATRTLTSPAGFNNNQWHHVVGTLSPAGMVLYVDGARVGSRVDTTTAQGYTGYWRVGGDNQGGWPNTGSSAYFEGQISDVAVYDRALSRNDVDANWVAAGRPSTLPTAPADTYGQAVYDLEPTLYWRLGEASGTVAADAGKDGATGTYNGAFVTHGAAGALNGVSNTAASFNLAGTPGYLSSDRQYSNPTVYSLETWFNTTSTAGGALLGFGANRTGTSGNHDRHVYMTSDGTVKFGVYTGAITSIQSGAGFNNGAWHHVVATQSSAGQRLYLDGVLVASNANAIAQNYSGYWRVAGDTAWEGATWWRGTLDEVAIYGQPLTAQQVQQHYSLGRDGKINVLPTASFAATPTNLAVAFDGSASADPDGSIASYAWNFGDGATETLATATTSHTYAAPGTFTTTLTVTDDSGATATFSAPVTVTAANVPPVASFELTQGANSGPSITVDGSGSSDPDGGTIVSHQWTFGDGSSDVGATSAHTYTASGDYTVTLTVTDNRGGSTSTSKSVQVVLPNSTPVAAFTSTVTNLTVAFNGSGSSDADGDTLTYAWNFGDGATDTGQSPSHTYTAAADTSFTVTLTVSDGQATDSVSHSVTVGPKPNTKPVAAFSSTVTGLDADFNAGASSDADDDTLTYAWDFGDGENGTGVSPSHTYAAGTYQVTLTVSDGQATDSVTHQVVLSSGPTEVVVAKDTFARTAAAGSWGSADQGGAWTLSGGNPAFSVSGGKGLVTLTPGATRAASLKTVTGSSMTTDVKVASNVASAGAISSATVIGRQVGSAYYGARVRFETTGVVRIQLIRYVTSEAWMGTSLDLPGTYTPGDQIRVKVSVTGTSPTTVSFKAWYASGAEPASWQRTTTDSTAALQDLGYATLRSAASSSSTVPSTVLSYDDLTVTKLQ